MDNQIVIYNNAVNELSFKEFTENDFNLFMAICSRMKELGDTTQQIDYAYIQSLINWDRRQRAELFHNELMKMADKLRRIGATVNVNQDEFVSFNLFSTFRGNKKKKILTIKTNPDFAYILNDLTKNFTRFELREYVSLDGKYSKLIYQHLRQYRKTGWWNVSIEDIRRDLAIPDSYANKYIMDKVIKPSIEVLKTCKSFSDLTVEPVQSTGRGRAIVGYKFKWTAENQIPGQSTLVDAQEEIQKYRAEKQAERNKQKKNTFTDFQQREIDFDALERSLIQKEINLVERGKEHEKITVHGELSD